VNVVLRAYLEECAGVRGERLEAWRRIQDPARKSGMSSGGEGLPKREELYDRESARNRSSEPL